MHIGHSQSTRANLLYHRLQGKLYAFSLLHTLNARDSINTSSNGQLPSVWKEGRREKALSRIPLPFRQVSWTYYSYFCRYDDRRSTDRRLLAQSRNDSAPAADQEDVYPYFASVKVTTNTYIHASLFLDHHGRSRQTLIHAYFPTPRETASTTFPLIRSTSAEVGSTTEFVVWGMIVA